MSGLPTFTTKYCFLINFPSRNLRAFFMPAGVLKQKLAGVASLAGVALLAGHPACQGTLGQEAESPQTFQCLHPGTGMFPWQPLPRPSLTPLLTEGLSSTHTVWAYIPSTAQALPKHQTQECPAENVCAGTPLCFRGCRCAVTSGSRSSCLALPAFMDSALNRTQQSFIGSPCHPRSAKPLLTCNNFGQI